MLVVIGDFNTIMCNWMIYDYGNLIEIWSDYNCMSLIQDYCPHTYNLKWKSTTQCMYSMTEAVNYR